MNQLKSSGKPFDISKLEVWNAWLKVKGNQGAPGGRWAVAGGVRGRSKEPSVQDLESDVIGQLLSVPGQGGGDPEGAWRGHPHVGGTDHLRSGGPDGGRRPAGSNGRADLPPRLLRLSAEPINTGGGRGVPEALLDIRLGDRSRHPEIFRQRAVGSRGQGRRGAHRRSVGSAVCEAVAGRSTAARRRVLAAAGPGDSARVGGLARTGESVHAQRPISPG